MPTWRARFAVVVVLALAAQLGLEVSALAAPAFAKGQAWAPPGTPVPRTAPVPRGSQQGESGTPGLPTGSAPPYSAPPVRLPAAGTYSVALTSSGPVPRPDGIRVPGVSGARGPTPVPGSALWVAPPVGGGLAPAQVDVTFAAVDAAARARIASGLLFGVVRNDGIAGAGRVQVQLDTSALAGRFGGNYADRLTFAQLPACALTTPEIAACRSRTPLAVSRDAGTGRLTADIALPAESAPGASMQSASAPQATSASGMVVVAADSAPAGSTGNYAATSVKSSDQWSAGGATGTFGYAYPVALPPALGGDEPGVSLSYSSAAVDGLTSSTNAQASWVGSGWSYEPGYIERTYQPCSQDGISGSGDTCWAYGGQEVTLGGNDSGGQIVYDDGSHTWHLSGDSGATIKLQTGGNNGAYNGEYWVITQQDGTRYYYGAGHLPGVEGGAGADPASNGAWTEPVYCPKSADPCYSAASGAGSYAANMAYRWNLDYVVDPHGNAMVYNDGTEVNYYSRGSGFTLTPYVRNGYLQQIGYGWRASDVATQTTPAPAAKVVFSVGQRCTGTATECS